MWNGYMGLEKVGENRNWVGREDEQKFDFHLIQSENLHIRFALTDIHFSFTL